MHTLTHTRGRRRRRCGRSVVYTGALLRLVDSVGQGDARSPAMHQVTAAPPPLPIGSTSEGLLCCRGDRSRSLLRARPFLFISASFFELGWRAEMLALQHAYIVTD